MKNTKWATLLSAAILPLYSGCAQNRYPTTVVKSGPAYQEPAPNGEIGGQPPPPAANGDSYGAPPDGAQSSAGAPANISPAAAEMIKMAESGVSEDVLIAYAQKSPTRYDLSADTILYLKDLGLTSPVITAMVNRDGSLRNDPQAQVSQPQYAPPQAQQGPPPGQNEGPGPAVQAAQPVYASNPPEDVNYFYDNLSPYGTWVVLDGVGWCWQPRAVVVDRGWSPYCNSGHWVFTDCGWFWQSDYSWGWAPFHYGRWYQHERCGWVWTPDRTWGPAWVTWRSGGDSCGWAPLPPHAEFDVRLGWRFNGVRVGATFDFGLRPDHFTFVAVHDFNRHDFARARLPVTEVRNVYNRTTIINNTTVVNNTIVNRGIPADRVAAATHTQVRKVSIKEQTASAGSGHITRDPGAARSGTVYREQLKTPPHPVKVVAQKVDNSHPVVQHTDIRQAAAARNQSFNASQRSGSASVPSRNQLDSRSSQRSGGLGNSTQPAPRDAVQPRNNSQAPQRDLPARDLPAATTRNQRQETPTVTPSPFSRGGRDSLQTPADRAQQPNSVTRQSQSASDNEVPRQYSPKGAQSQAERRSVEPRVHSESTSKSESRAEARGDNKKAKD